MSQKNNPHCSCNPTSFPFQCARHCVLKTKRKYDLCSLTADTADAGLKYWEQWEQGKDDKQDCTPVSLATSGPPKAKIIVPKRKIDKPQKKIRWAYGITTVETRADLLLPKTIQALKHGGFPSPRLFVDGMPPIAAEEQYGKYKLHITARFPQVKTFANWYLSLIELYLRDPQAARYAIFQDDMSCYRNLRTYLDGIKIPEKGYLNLYTFPVNEANAPADFTGFYKSNQRGLGAVALVFSNEVTRKLLTASHMINKPRGKKSTWSVDGGIVDSLKKQGIYEYVHYPSLVQHRGEQSSMHNPKHPVAISYKGDAFDATRLLLPKKQTGNELGDQVSAALSSVGITQARVNKWLGRPCKCPARIAKLNKISRWAKGILAGEKEAGVAIRKVLGVAEEKTLIVIPAKDCADMTMKCLEHLHKYADIAYDVLYIDDASQDGVAEKIANHAHELNVPLTVQKFSAPVGFHRACNIGFTTPGYAYVLLLNNDCFIGPKCLSTLKNWLTSDTNIAAINPLTCDRGKLSIQQKSRREKAGLLRPPQDPRSAKEGASLCINESTSEEEMLPFFCTLIRRTAITAIGLQNTHENFAYGLGADDEWCERAIEKGWRLLVANNAYAAHVHHYSFKKHAINRNNLSIEASRHNRTTAGAPSLSIVTRVHPNRPAALQVLKKSIAVQTSAKYEHVLLPSPGEIGIAGANKMLADGFEYAGNYLQIIDDDDMICDKTYVEKLSEFIVAQGYPDWVMVRTKIRNKQYPIPFGIKWLPKHATIPSFSVIISKKLWDTHRQAWDAKNSGDWQFVKSLWAAGERPVWFDFMACKSQRGHSNGKGE